MNDERVYIFRRGAFLFAVIKNLNIRIIATFYGRYLNFQVIVPRFLCELSFGHLGNCDGNPNNDVSGPNDRELKLSLQTPCFSYTGDQDCNWREARGVGGILQSHPLMFNFDQNSSK